MVKFRLELYSVIGSSAVFCCWKAKSTNSYCLKGLKSICYNAMLFCMPSPKIVEILQKLSLCCWTSAIWIAISFLTKDDTFSLFLSLSLSHCFFFPLRYFCSSSRLLNYIIRLKDSWVTYFFSLIESCTVSLIWFCISFALPFFLLLYLWLVNSLFWYIIVLGFWVWTNLVLGHMHSHYGLQLLHLGILVYFVFVHITFIT